MVHSFEQLALLEARAALAPLRGLAQARFRHESAGLPPGEFGAAYGALCGMRRGVEQSAEAGDASGERGRSHRPDDHRAAAALRRRDRRLARASAASRTPRAMLAWPRRAVGLGAAGADAVRRLAVSGGTGADFGLRPAMTLRDRGHRA